jgi:hypothetical protein
LYIKKDLKTTITTRIVYKKGFKNTITTRIVYKKGFKNTNNNDKDGDKMRSVLIPSYIQSL